MDSGDLQEFRKTKKVSSREVDWCLFGKAKRFTELESESGGSSEEIDYSPKSVWKFESPHRSFPPVHHQVLKIREEDSHLGEDIGEGQSAREKIAFLHLKSHVVDALIMSRPILPSSPLSGKTAINSLH